MKELNVQEFGKLIEDVKLKKRALEDGCQVFNGMVHKNTVVMFLGNIANEMEMQLDKMNKYVIERDRLARMGEKNESSRVLFENDRLRIEKACSNYPLGSNKIAEIVEFSAMLEGLGIDVKGILETEFYGLLDRARANR